MRQLHSKESWAPKNYAFELWCWRRLLRVPCKEIQPVHSKGDQSRVLFGRLDAKAETPILWPPHVKSWLIGKDPDAGRDWGQEEKGMTEDELAGWHHWLDGHEYGLTLGVGDGQGGLVCCNSRGRKELDRTEQLNWTELWSMWLDWLVFCDCGFHSVCPLMEKDKRLMEASWCDRLTEGESGI